MNVVKVDVRVKNALQRMAKRLGYDSLFYFLHYDSADQLREIWKKCKKEGKLRNAGEKTLERIIALKEMLG